MPPVYYLYIDGVSVATISGLVTWYVESDGLWGEAHGSRLWTYSGLGTFLGFSTTSGATLPDTDYSVGKTISFTPSSSIYLYSVAVSNEAYLTTGFDLTSIADAIRTKTWGTSDLTFPSQYISSISNLPVGNIESSRSVVYNTPGSATITPSSGYVGFESAYIEFAPNVWDGQYTWTPPPNSNN